VTHCGVITQLSESVVEYSF